MTRRWMIALVAAAMLVAAGGCNNDTRTIDASSGAPRQVEPFPELVARSRPPIPDLPMPIGFKLDEGKSRNFAAAGARYIDHIYKGKANKFAVARFYRRQMPTNRWTLVTDRFVQGDVILDFEKETERCYIVITKGSLFRPTRIKAQLWTSGRIEAPVGEQK
ncbi:MAG: hypothetical protein KAU28_02905 [Phycisphaerae bacterium]|nr:hypothetical protein [Phycisphaerae bacterium]